MLKKGDFMKSLCSLSVLLILLVTLGVGAILAPEIVIAAEELPIGFIITAKNLDEVLSKTFEGHTISSLLPEKHQWAIKNWGLRIKLGKSHELKIDNRWYECTRRYAGDVKYDPQTHRLSNHTCGVPFPNIDPSDPEAGYKIYWNVWVGLPSNDYQDASGIFLNLSADTKGGITRSQLWQWYKYRVAGRLREPHTESTGTTRGELYRELLFGVYPYDVKGIGAFTIRYLDGRVDNKWAYVRSVRRVRRLTGGSWFDPVGNFVMIQDEIQCLSGHPTWYKFKLLGKRWMLHYLDSMDFPNVYPEAKTSIEKYPCVDLENFPYWWPKPERTNWHPREVYVLEVTMPPEHPFSKRILYVDIKTWAAIFSEAYDQKGKFVRHAFVGYNVRKTSETDVEGYGLGATNIQIADYERRCGFASFTPDYFLNVPGVKASDFKVDMLETGALLKGRK